MTGFELHHVSRTVAGEEGAPLQLLNQVDCRISPGRITALVGPSGSGKTSLLRLLNRLDAPDHGSVAWSGTDLSHQNPQQLRRKIAFVPQQPHMFPGSARDNLLQGLRYLPRADQPISEERIGQLCELSLFPKELLVRPAERLSTGQQQRLALGRALLLEPEVLLLDEPSSALDRPTAEQLGRVLRRLCAQGSTIILVSHDLAWVRSVADEVLFVAAGDVLVQKDAAGFFQDPENDLAKRFLDGDMRKGGEEA